MNRLISILLLIILIFLTNLLGIFYFIPFLQDTLPESLWKIPIFENDLLSIGWQSVINLSFLGAIFFIILSSGYKFTAYLRKVFYSFWIYDSILLQQYFIGVLLSFPVFVLLFLQDTLQCMYYFQGDYIAYAYIVSGCAMGIVHLLREEEKKKSVNDQKNETENPIREKKEDFLGFTDEIEKQILPRIKHIMITEINSVKNIEHPFITFWIFGNWGSGKTSFLNLTEYILEEENKNRTSSLFNKIWILDFDVSQYSNPSNLYISLYELILEKIETEIILPFRTRSSMTNAVLETVGNSYLRFFTNIFSPEITIDAYTHELSQVLCKLQKSIVLKIENLDRLPTSEMDYVFKLLRLLKNTRNLFALVTTDESALIRYSQNFIHKEITNSIDNVGKYFDYYFKISEPTGKGIEDTVTAYIDEIINASEKLDSNFKDLVKSQINQKRETFLGIYRKYLNNFRKIKFFKKKLQYNVSVYGEYIYFPDLVLISIIEATNIDLLSVISNKNKLFFTSDFKMEEAESKRLECTELLASVGNSNDILLEVFPLIKFVLEDYDYSQNEAYNNRFQAQKNMDVYKEHRFFHEFSMRFYFQSFTKDEFLKKAMNLQEKNKFILYLENSDLQTTKENLFSEFESLFISDDSSTFEYREFLYNWLEYETHHLKSDKMIADKIVLLLSYLVKKLPGLKERTSEKNKILGFVSVLPSKELIEIIISDLDTSDFFVQQVIDSILINSEDEPVILGYLLLFLDRLNKKIQLATDIFDLSFSDASYEFLILWNKIQKYNVLKNLNIQIPDMNTFVFETLAKSKNRIDQFNLLCTKYLFHEDFKANYEHLKENQDFFNIHRVWTFYSFLSEAERTQIPLSYRDKLKEAYKEFQEDASSNKSLENTKSNQND